MKFKCEKNNVVVARGNAFLSTQIYCIILICHFNKSIKGEESFPIKLELWLLSLSDWINLTILMKIEITTVEVI
jgi:hypothetical protein